LKGQGRGRPIAPAEQLAPSAPPAAARIRIGRPAPMSGTSIR
jgi:hypothetical protein